MVKDQRTVKQNRSLHLYFTQVAQALNDAGYNVKAVLKLFKNDFEIEFTQYIVKELLWRTAQKAMYGKQSTKELKAYKEINEIHKIVSRFLSEKLAIPYIPLPFECDECHGLSTHYDGCSMKIN